MRVWMMDLMGTCIRPFAVGSLALATLSAPAIAQDGFTTTLDTVVRSVCMNDGMRFDERIRTLTALGWSPAGDMEMFQLFADLEARAYLLGYPDSNTSDLQADLTTAAANFEKLNARRLGAHEDSLDRIVFLQSASLPGLTLELVKFQAPEGMTVDICKFAAANPPADFLQYVQDSFVLAPAKENALGRHRVMRFSVASKIEKTWSLEVTEAAAEEGNDAIPMLLSINTRTRQE